MPIARRLLPVLLAAAALAGCENKTPGSEEKAVRDSFEVALFVPDPQFESLRVHAAWLGPDAIPPILKSLAGATTNDKKRITLARLLDILAWNGIRTQDSVKALSQLTKDKAAPARLFAYDGLFASAANLSDLDSYWDPGDPTKNVDPSKVNALPFSNCRQLLLQMKLPLPEGKDGSVAGDAGRTHKENPPVPQAGALLGKIWTKETEPNLRSVAAIQAYRLGAVDPVDAFIQALKPPPPPMKPTPAWEISRARALRVLQEVNHKDYDTYEEWQAWRKSSMPPPKPPPTREPPK